MKTPRPSGLIRLLTASCLILFISSQSHSAVSLKKKKDTILDVNTSSFHVAEQQQSTAGHINAFGLGVITFEQGSFSLTRQFSIDQTNFSATVPGACPPGSYAFLPFVKFSMLWEDEGDALLLVKDDSLPNGTCLAPTGPVSLINLTVDSGTGPFSCASGNWSRIVDNSLTPPELSFLTSEDVSMPGEAYLVFLPSSEGKSVTDPNQPQGTVTIPAVCP